MFVQLSPQFHSIPALRRIADTRPLCSRSFDLSDIRIRIVRFSPAPHALRGSAFRSIAPVVHIYTETTISNISEEQRLSRSKTIHEQPFWFFPVG
jgi:hypothetical protein